MLQGQKSEEALEDTSQWENHGKDDEAGSWARWEGRRTAQWRKSPQMQPM